jgi:hypothetical protein
MNNEHEVLVVSTLQGSFVALGTLAAVWLVGCAHPIPGAHAGAATLPSAMQSLGYEAIALDAMVTGHLLARAEVGGTTLQLVVDSGASKTVMRPEAAEAIGVATAASSETAGGVGGGGVTLRQGTAPDVRIGALELAKLDFYVMDLAALNAQFTAAGAQPVDGVIGADWLVAQQAVLSIASQELFVKHRSAHERRDPILGAGGSTGAPAPSADSEGAGGRP